MELPDPHLPVSKASPKAHVSRARRSLGKKSLQDVSLDHLYLRMSRVRGQFWLNLAGVDMTWLTAVAVTPVQECVFVLLWPPDGTHPHVILTSVRYLTLRL